MAIEAIKLVAALSVLLVVCASYGSYVEIKSPVRISNSTFVQQIDDAGSDTSGLLDSIVSYHEARKEGEPASDEEAKVIEFMGKTGGYIRRNPGHELSLFSKFILDSDPVVSGDLNLICAYTGIESTLDPRFGDLKLCANTRGAAADILDMPRLRELGIVVESTVPMATAGCMLAIYFTNPMWSAVAAIIGGVLLGAATSIWFYLVHWLTPSKIPSSIQDFFAGGYIYVDPNVTLGWPSISFVVCSFLLITLGVFIAVETRRAARSDPVHRKRRNQAGTVVEFRNPSYSFA